jgi:hypothetical protein
MCQERTEQEHLTAILRREPITSSVAASGVIENTEPQSSGDCAD